MQVLTVGGDVIEQPARRFEQSLVVRSIAIRRNKTDVQSDGSTAEQLREVGDFLHLLHPRRASRFWDETDRVGRGRDVSVALAIETTEHACHCNSRRIAVGKKRVGGRLRTRRLVWRVNLNSGDAQFAGDIQMNAQSGIDRCENSNLPRLHGVVLRERCY